MIFPLPGGLGQIKASPGFSALDPAQRFATVVGLSNNNLTATCLTGAGGLASVRGTRSLNAGKVYFEVTVAAFIAAQGGAGLCNASFVATANGASVGYDVAGNSWGLGALSSSMYTLFGQASYTSAGLSANGDTLMVAMDFAGQKLYFGLNGLWLAAGSTTFNAAMQDFGSVAGPLWPLLTVGSDTSGTNKSVLIFNPGSSAFKYAPPTGFSAWG